MIKSWLAVFVLLCLLAIIITCLVNLFQASIIVGLCVTLLSVIIVAASLLIHK